MMDSIAFSNLETVAYNPFGAGAMTASCKVTISVSSGRLVTGLDAVLFNFARSTAALNLT
jgi:hypothetical protein